MPVRSVLLVLMLLPCPALPCSLCSNIRQRTTLRQEASQPTARLVLHGYLADPRPRQDVAGAGTTDFHVLEVLKADATVPPEQMKRPGAVIVLGSYVPIVDPKNPPQYLLFCDLFGGKLDVYRSVEVKSARTAKYLEAALKLDPQDARGALLFFFRHLDHPDPEIATDAFMEMTRASDQVIGEVAKELPPEPLRRWLRCPTTSEE